MGRKNSIILFSPSFLGCVWSVGPPSVERPLQLSKMINLPQLLSLCQRRLPSFWQKLLNCSPNFETRRKWNWFGTLIFSRLCNATSSSLLLFLRRSVEKSLPKRDRCKQTKAGRSCYYFFLSFLEAAIISLSSCLGRSGYKQSNTSLAHTKAFTRSTPVWMDGWLGYIHSRVICRMIFLFG